jgi:hypothetical protein
MSGLMKNILVKAKCIKNRYSVSTFFGFNLSIRNYRGLRQLNKKVVLASPFAQLIVHLETYS